MSLVVDTHTHLATADTTAYPRAGNVPFATDDYLNEAAAFLAKMDVAGVDRAIVVQAFGLYGFDNSYHADAAAAEPRFIGVCGLDPADPGSPDAVDHWCGKRGMAGVRLSYFGKGVQVDPAHAGLRAIAGRCERGGWPLAFLTTRASLAGIGRLATDFPALPIALDHLGVMLGDPEKVGADLFALAALPNVHLKFATPALLAEGVHRDFLLRVIDRFGPARMLWGSDYPHTNTGGYPAMVAAALTVLAFLSPAERDAVFGGNALRLWRKEA